jgi:hypothetical protein
MEKNYKMTLALLYLLQLLIVFRESVTEAYKHAVEVIHGRVESDAEHGTVAHEQEDEDGFRWEHAALAHVAFVLAHGHAEHHEHVLHHHRHDEPETEDEVQKTRRRRWREVLLANLFPSMRRFAAPAQAMDAPASVLLRMVGHPSAVIAAS